MAYSKDLRKRVLDYVERGGSKIQAAQLFQINVRTIFMWLQQGRDYQRGKPGPRTSHKFKREELARLVARQPDALLKELAAQLGVKSINTVSHALIQMGISRKKNAAVRPGLRA
jgi:putative transposase